MPADPRDPSVPAPILRADAARTRAAARLADETVDLFLPADARLDDRLRAAVEARLRATVGAVERELRLGAARRLTNAGAMDAAEMLLSHADTALDRLRRTDLLRTPALVAELLGVTRLALLARHLPPGAPTGADRPSLVVRLAECPEPDVAAAAVQLLQVRNAVDGTELPATFRMVLPQWVAAALREGIGDDVRADQALTDAAMALSAEQPGESEESAALRLAEVIAALPDELPDLLVESLGDRHPALFVALIAVAGGLSFADVGEIVHEPDGARLWLLLRAQGLERTMIARIGVALAAADGARDLDRFADEIDEVVAISPAVAAECFASLALPVEYRCAREALERA